METRRRDARLRERRPAHAPAGHRELLGARPALAGGARLVLARGRRRPRARVQPAVGRGLRRLARARVDDVVQRRHGLDRPELRPPLGGARSRTGSARSSRERTARAASSRSPSSHGTSPGSPRAWRGSASIRATASRSTCRCAPRSRSPPTPAPTSAQCRCRSSRASPLRRSCSGCRTRRRRS